MRFSAGSRLGPYEILSPLGSGGMGEVYRAIDTRLGRVVAVKVLGEHLVDKPDAVKRFQQEAQAAGALSHPNILAVYEFDIEGGTPIVVTELLEGSTLRDCMASPLSWRKVLEFGAAIADGLSAAHKAGIIHRDLKPQNIFITDEGRVKILDFGLAHLKESAVSVATSTTTMDARTPAGTLGYGAPEQLTGHSPAPTMDIFSLGVMLYEMLSGQHPFRAASAAETIAAVLDCRPAPLTPLDPQTPVVIQSIVNRCLEKMPQQRFQSAHDLACELRDAITFSDSQSRVVSPRLRRWWRPAAATVAAVAVGTIVYTSIRTSGPVNASPAASINSLAVLPLTNTSNDPSLEYVTDGITECLINQVSELPGLTVTARPTAFRYKARAIDPVAVGKELRVRALATGRVEGRGNGLRIQADLIDARTGAQLWGRTYNRQKSDIADLPNEIAGEIARELRLRLSGGQEARLSATPTKNATAYDLYLKGLHALNRHTRDGREEAISYFQQAVDIDHGYARAWAALAVSYVRLGLDVSPREMRTRGRDAAKRALEIDPGLAEAHMAVGLLRLWDEWDLAGAEAEFKQALALNPNLAQAHGYYSSVLQYRGHFRESVKEAERALQLDPLSRGNTIFLAGALLAMNENARVEMEMRQLLNGEPEFPAARYLLARALLQQGKTKEACDGFVAAYQAAGVDADHLSALRGACANGDMKAFERERLKYLLARDPAVTSYEVAAAYAYLGENAKAYEYLEKAYRERSSGLLELAIAPEFDAMRHDTRFTELMKRVGLTPVATR